MVYTNAEHDEDSVVEIGSQCFRLVPNTTTVFKIISAVFYNLLSVTLISGMARSGAQTARRECRVMHCQGRSPRRRPRLVPRHQARANMRTPPPQPTRDPTAPAVRCYRGKRRSASPLCRAMILVH